MRPVGFAIDGSRNRDNSRERINAESTAVIVGQAVGDAIGCRVKVFRKSRQIDRRTNRRILINLITSIIPIYRSRHAELIHVSNGDHERLFGKRSIRTGGSDND